MLIFVLSLALVFLFGMFVGWMVHDVLASEAKRAARADGRQARRSPWR